MTDSAHAFYSPSAMHRIVRCPGSVRATAGLADIPSPWAQDGTEAHALLSLCLNTHARDAKTCYAERVNVSIPPFVYRADDETSRFDSVQLALDEVYSILDAYEDAQLYIEQQVTFPSMVTTDCWGTADIVIIVPSMGLLYVLDFKHGAGVAVDAKDNEQLQTYACAALSTFREAHKVHTVITGIIQPRAFSADGPVRYEDALTVEKYITDKPYTTSIQLKIDAAIKASQAPDAPLVPGEKQCQFCPLKANCPAREAAALAVVSSTFANVKDVTRAALPAVSQIPVDRLAYIMSASSILKGWLSDVESTALELARNGVYIPGFKLVETLARRQWYQDDDSTASMLMSLTGLNEDFVRPRKLIGITEAEKLVVDAFKSGAGRGKKKQAAEAGKNAFAHLTTKASSGNVTLVPETDQRPAINLAQQTFDNVSLPAQG